MNAIPVCETFLVIKMLQKLLLGHPLALCFYFLLGGASWAHTAKPNACQKLRREKMKTSTSLDCDQSFSTESRGVIISGEQETVLSADSHTHTHTKQAIDTTIVFRQQVAFGRQSPPAERPLSIRLC